MILLSRSTDYVWIFVAVPRGGASYVSRVVDDDNNFQRFRWLFLWELYTGYIGYSLQYMQLLVGYLVIRNA